MAIVWTFFVNTGQRRCVIPYSGKDDPDLPKNVQDMPEAIRAQWVEVFNSTYQSCIDGGDDSKDCEAKAFKYANGVAKKSTKEGEMNLPAKNAGTLAGFFFNELGADALTSGKTFDGMAPGVFWDMYGRKVTINKKDFPEYLKHTKQAIEFSKTDAGEVIGLPIDCDNHDKGDGAGWIVDASIDEVEKPDGSKIPVMRFAVNWTEIGKELIEKGIRRMFSPTVDTQNRVVLGGSLTNWPATRDKVGKVLLRPIELSAGETVYELADDVSLDEQAWQVRDAFRAKFPPTKNGDFEATGPYVRDVFEDFVIIRMDEDNYRAAYSRNTQGDIEFAEQSEWVKVRQSWVEAAKAAWRKVQEMFIGYEPDGAGAPAANQSAGNPTPSEQGKPAEASHDNPPSEGGEGDIEMTKEELLSLITGMTDEERKSLVGLLKPAAAPDSNAVPGATLDLSKLLENGELDEKFKTELKTKMQAEANALREAARKEFEIELVREQHQAAVTKFCELAIGGRQDAPRGLPVDAGKLKEFCLGLQPDQLKFFQDLVGAVQTRGLVEFQELGNGKQPKGTLPLPEYYAAKLESGELKLADLRNPLLAPELGDISQYDLRQWDK